MTKKIIQASMMTLNMNYCNTGKQMFTFLFTIDFFLHLVDFSVACIARVSLCPRQNAKVKAISYLF